MRKAIKILIGISIVSAITLSLSMFKTGDERFVSIIVDPKKDKLEFFWKDEESRNFASIENLKLWLYKKNKKLRFATNGGMYQKNGFPQGLFIQANTTLSELDTASGSGNFYLKPNGVFYLTNGKSAQISTTEKFRRSDQVQFATQSGPMLVTNGEIHPSFKKGSTNLNVRNGVGILPDNTVVFVLSKKEVNFYDFAEYFKNLGCKEALYLDGFVSRMYLPEENWIQTDGNFGVIIGVVE